MERRQFLTAGTGTILGLAGLGRADASVQSEQGQDESDFDAFVSELDTNLGKNGVEVIDAGHCLGIGVLATTTQADETTEEVFADELGVVWATYVEYLEIAEAPPGIGFVVEVYESSDDAGNRQNRFARYFVDTTLAREALETGDPDPLVLSMVLNVWPPVVEEFQGLLDEDGEGDQNGGDNEPAGRSDLEVVEHGALDFAESDDETSLAVEARVKNRGDRCSGDVELVVDWYDADGRYVDTDESRLHTLLPGETWVARVYPGLVEVDDIADYQISLVYDDPEYTRFDRVSIGESELIVGENARIHGEITNETGAELSYVELVGRVLDVEGRLLGDDYTNELDVAANETWRFDISYSDRDRSRLNVIEDYQLLAFGRR